MSADATDAAKAILTAKPASYERRYRWLDGEDAQVEGQFDCTLEFVDTAKVEIVEHTHKARHMRESCAIAGLTIVNDYWVGMAKPVIWQSRQWIGQELGYLNLTVLIPN